jgi:hypothetical protein
MQIDLNSATYRAGVARGAKLAEEHFVSASPAEVAELQDWIRDLEQWTSGAMPPPPCEWSEEIL